MKRSAPDHEDIGETMKLNDKPATASSQMLNADGGDWMS